MTSVVLVGCTGLVGSHILQTIVSDPKATSLTVTTISRRVPLNIPEDKYRGIHDSDTSTWAERLAGLKSEIFITALGTTKAAAGSLENQRKIDYDLNLQLARTAVESGSKTCVLVSTAVARPNSMIPYERMKGELEEGVMGLGFEKVVFIKAGLLVGQREKGRAMESIAGGLANFMGSINKSLKDFWAQDAEVVAKAAVSAAMACSQGKAPEGKVWNVQPADIVRLGRTEWETSK